MKWIGKLPRGLLRIFQPSVARKVLRAIELAAPYVDEAVQVVQWIAKMAGNRSPERIEGLVKLSRAEVPLGLPPSDVMRLVAQKLMTERYPEARKSDLNRAIEIAVGASR